MLAECEQQRRTKEQPGQNAERSEEHTSELQSRLHLVCRLLLEKKKKKTTSIHKSSTITTNSSYSQSMHTKPATANYSYTIWQQYIISSCLSEITASQIYHAKLS